MERDPSATLLVLFCPFVLSFWISPWLASILSRPPPTYHSPPQPLITAWCVEARNGMTAVRMMKPPARISAVARGCDQARRRRRPIDQDRAEADQLIERGEPCRADEGGG